MRAVNSGFDEQCKEAQMQALRLKKIFNRNPSAENWEEYRVARAFKGRLINKKKRDSYHEYCQKACDFPIAMRQAYKTARKPGQRSSYLPLIQRSDKSTTNDPRERLKYLETHFFLPHLTPISLILKILYIHQG